MDFEWTDHRGPVDSRSPFFAHGQQQSGNKRESSSTVTSTSTSIFLPPPYCERNNQELISPPGNHAALDSPNKGFATPTRARDPDTRPSFFASLSNTANKPLPSTPASSLPHHLAWEPRTPASTYDFSSGGETPQTPQVDSDAGTPDTQLAGKMGRLGNGEGGNTSPKKLGRRDSWAAFKGIFTGGGGGVGSASPSPAKERERERSRSTYSKKTENRITKRRAEQTSQSSRSRSKKRHQLRYEDDGPDDSPPVAATVAPPTLAMSLSSFLTWVEAHPHLPSVLSFYLQLAVNTFLGGLFIYILYSAYSSILLDIDVESSKHVSAVLIEISACAMDFQRNRCDEPTIYMEQPCAAWRACMQRDPKRVARASVSAKTFAGILNGFVEEVGWKSMVCFISPSFPLFSTSSCGFPAWKTR